MGLVPARASYEYKQFFLGYPPRANRLVKSPNRLLRHGGVTMANCTSWGSNIGLGFGELDGRAARGSGAERDTKMCTGRTGCSGAMLRGGVHGTVMDG